MSDELGAIFFDVDGVLVDSLPAHLSVCHDKADAYGLSIEIPSIEEFRTLVACGALISPMVEFFAAVGFPPAEAARAVSEYESDFAARYKPPAYTGVDDVLQTLSHDGWKLGVVTSNTRKNIEYSLGKSILFFDQRCIFTLDKFADKHDKTWCLLEGARIFDRRPEHCFFIGDLPSDALAADRAGFKFIAATYGWGLSKEGRGKRWINSVEQIPSTLRGLLN